MKRETMLQSWLRYAADPAAFVRECACIYDATGQDWIKFDLWPAQAETLATMAGSRKLVMLKARQLGITWLCLAYALWLMIFKAPATILLFSLREEEAKELLWRLRGMYERLPAWLQAKAVTHSNETRWLPSNGSRAMAFSTKAGRSYTGTLALVDEADFVPELAQFLNGVKPTIDAGGQLFLVSTADKKRPVSTFKNLFRAAEGEYRRVFLPWWARPGRDEGWRATVQAEMYAQRGTNDDFYAEYPGTAEEALAAEQLDRRLPWEWVKGCVARDVPGSPQEVEGRAGYVGGVPGSGRPAVPGMEILAGHTSPILSVAFSPDGQTLASGSEDLTVRLWDVRTGEQLRALERHNNGVESVAFSPDGGTLASGSWDSLVRLWDARTGEKLRALVGDTGGVTSVAFSPDGQTLASGNFDDTVRLWPVTSP